MGYILRTTPGGHGYLDGDSTFPDVLPEGLEAIAHQNDMVVADAEARANEYAATLAYGTDLQATDATVAGFVDGVGGTQLKSKLDGRFAPRVTTATGAQVGGSALFEINSSSTTGRFDHLSASDDAGHDGHTISLSHYAATAGSYAIDIANYPGSQRAFVIHQYSAAAEAMVIDNTDSNAALMIRNTENTTRNPGKTGTGDFIRFVKFGDPALTSLALTKDLVWLNKTTSQVVFRSTASSGGVSVDHQGPSGVALTVSQGVAGLFSGSFIGGAGVKVEGTGANATLRIYNGDTSGTIAAFYSGISGATLRASVLAGGDLELHASNSAVILKAPNGTRYRVTVTNAGAVQAVAA